MSKEYVDFGFKDILRSDKASMVRNLFGRVAGQYDIMNDLMSVGLHRHWKKDFIHALALKKGDTILDVAAGTGDISIRLRQAFPFLDLTTILVDLTPEMLTEGKRKATDKGIVKNISFITAQAEQLPIDDNSVDIYTISFGLRNVADRTQALSEAYRVLKPGGHFYCLEFSHMEHTTLQKVYDAYSFSLLPFLGKHVANDEDAYVYLAESIRRFPDRHALESEMKDAQFSRVESQPWSGGIVAFHHGVK